MKSDKYIEGKDKTEKIASVLLSALMALIIIATLILWIVA